MKQDTADWIALALIFAVILAAGFVGGYVSARVRTVNEICQEKVAVYFEICEPR